ncbi:MAG TPA: tyrosine-type recombinase/integrase [Sulfurimonas sp.]|uniref:tyrosine-type recombinase/integrase n=1 Tax=Sulfurimonas sp. TaxID=2022749 RepID=UPI002CCF8616|nr:tyrosine-type recombinase/integrase [Sulfurimonas sp.]HUH43294.1 tyrosine-type recombinase/integrase [Sulfurimonas sp.]
MSNELEAFIEYISVIKALSKKSVDAYRSDLEQIELSLNKPLISLDSKTLFNLLSQYKNKRTLNRKLSSVNAFFDFCYKNQFVDEKKKLKFSKISKLLPKFLSYQEIQNALSLIDRSTIIGLRDYAIIIFLYATGARISECLALSKEDIEGEWLYIRHAKGEKERIVPIASIAKVAVDAYLNELDKTKEYVWQNYKGDRLSRISAYKITQKYLGVSPHVLRHSYATALIAGGADLRVVQELLGHSSLLSTQIYTHIQKQDLKETLEVCHPMAKESL